ncbi:glycosyltransferase 87 family protein [Natronoglycomyces albus]|uniref:DUF2029 domain-containing protein n=1 Tax=Natronoglycomyces albus TaxID=2811108 RepID=A0A895XPN0_9ACTN|nr:glycosyltransferase 87 family protein [Natronoglycomyces albus]QSB05329.1 DUF2029 domain-containing protein [Natronoglycomyces albus]
MNSPHEERPQQHEAHLVIDSENVEPEPAAETVLGRDSGKRPLHLDATLYALSALFAGATALWTVLPAHEYWGFIAIGGYAPAAAMIGILLISAAVPFRMRLLVAAATSAAVLLVPMLASIFQRAAGNPDRAQEEVLVIEASAQRLWDSGSPYLRAEEIAALSEPLLGYTPYQPGMAVFGLPKAIIGDYWWTDARLFFTAVTAVCLIAMLRLLRHRASKSALLRAFQASAIVPVCALTLSTGGDDMPVVALAALAIVLGYRNKWTWASLVMGAAATLKLIAWPLAIVLGILAYQRRQSARYCAIVAAPVILTLAPVALYDWHGVVDNVMAFPFGKGVIDSPAQSPLPGYLIASNVPGGSYIAIGLLLAAGALIAVALYRRPPLTASAAAAWCAAGLTVAIALMPATRFGYLLYPVVLLGWAFALRSAEEPDSPLVDRWR